jgi:hypothetical protein
MLRARILSPGVVALILSGCLREAQTPLAVAVQADGDQLCLDFFNGQEGPRCIVPISGEMQRHRDLSCRLRWRGGRVERVEHINGHGTLVPNEDGTQTHDYRYSDDFYDEIERGPGGKFVGRYHFEARGERGFSYDERGSPAPRKNTRFSLAMRTFDRRGFIIKYRFFDALGRPTPQENGAYERRMMLDDRGVELESSYYDKGGEPMTTAHGYHRYTLSPWVPGTIRELRNYSETGEPVMALDDVHRTVFSMDEWYNPIRRDFFDIRGARAETRWGTGNRSLRDEWGSVRESIRLGRDGNPAPAIDRVQRVVITHDAQGRFFSSRNFGKDDAPVRNLQQEFGVQLIHDADGRLAESRGLGADGQLLGPEITTHAIQTFQYGAESNLVETRFLDSRRQLIGGGQVAVIRIRWDHGRMAQESYFDRDGRLVNNADGFAELWPHDPAQAGQPNRYLDARGDPVEVWSVSQLLIAHQDSTAPVSVDRNRDEARARAEQIKAKIEAGVSFEILARMCSDDMKSWRNGGLLPPSVPGKFPKVVDLALRRAGVGHLTGVVDSPAGFLLLRRNP